MYFLWEGGVFSKLCYSKCYKRQIMVIGVFEVAESDGDIRFGLGWSQGPRDLGKLTIFF